MEFTFQQQISMIIKENETTVKSIENEFNFYKEKYNDDIISKFNDNIDKKNKEIFSLKQNIEKLNEKISKYELELEEQKKQNKQLMEEYSIVIGQKEDESVKYMEAINEYSNQIKLLQLELTDKNEKLLIHEENERKLVETEEIVSNLRNENDKLVKDLRYKAKELNNYKECNNQLELNIEAAKKTFNDYKNNKSNKINKTVQDLNSLLKKYESENKDLLIHLKIKEKSLTTWKAYTTQLQQQAQELQIGSSNNTDIDYM